MTKLYMEEPVQPTKYAVWGQGKVRLKNFGVLNCWRSNCWRRRVIGGFRAMVMGESAQNSAFLLLAAGKSAAVGHGVFLMGMDVVS